MVAVWEQEKVVDIGGGMAVCFMCGIVTVVDGCGSKLWI